MPLINTNMPWAARNPFASLQGAGQAPALSPDDISLVTRTPQPQTADNTMNTNTASQTAAALAANATNSGLSPDFLNFVKDQEGFSAKAFPDYKQFSIGYGTKATDPHEVLNEDQATQRLSDELTQSQQSIQKAAQAKGWNLNPSQLNALTSFDFNTGRGAYLLNTSKDLDQVKDRIGQYTHAGGEVNKGLVNRRKAELNMWG